MRLLLISGSTRAGSTNTAALRTLEELARHRDDVEDAACFDGLRELPAFDPDDDREPLPPSVAELRARLDEADAIVISTPEYAGMMPGSLKNLLDWTVGGGMWRKRVAILEVAIEGRGDAAVVGLRTVLDYVEAVVIEEASRRVFVPRDRVDEDGLVADLDIRAELDAILDALVAVPAPTAPT